jgi:hypothetical protein
MTTTMKRLLMTAAALLVLTGGANAAEMPKELRGAWCLDTDTGTYVPWGECTLRSGLSVGARGFDIVNGDCTALKVTRFGKRACRIRFRCQGEGIEEPLAIAHIWRIEKDALKVTVIKSGR